MDFLDNLVKRNLEPTAAIQPRQPALFEPAHIVGVQTVHHSIDHGQQDPNRTFKQTDFEGPRRSALLQANLERPRAESTQSTESVRQQPLAQLPYRGPLLNQPAESVKPAINHNAEAELSDQPTSGPAEWRIPEGVRQPPLDEPMTDPYRGQLLNQPAESVKPAINYNAEADLSDPPTSSPTQLTRPQTFALSSPPQAVRSSAMDAHEKPNPNPASPPSTLPTIEGKGAAARQQRPKLEPHIRRTVIERIEKREQTQPQTTPSRETASIAESRLSKQVSIVAQSQVTPAQRFAHLGSANARRKQTPQPEPTIHVTIGRVEVRAAPPAAPPPKARRSEPPVMSLDEYLRKRAGGDH